ncbi:MAG: response regulator, partial [Elusimicrobia bacterium]|nr:response regulator [Elusimicrobiota bacterium]
DDHDITNLLKRMLEIEGYSVVVVHDGQAALDAYRNERPALMVLDISMPIKNGVEVCQEIRQEDTETLILMLTGQKTQTNTVIGLSAGADAYVPKPFGSRELLARIKSLFRRLEI